MSCSPFLYQKSQKIDNETPNMKRVGVSKKIIAFMSIALAGIVLTIWTAWENKALIVSEIYIFSERLPASFSGFRIVHVSDLHNTEFGTDNATLLQMLSDNEPDIIVITGDLIDSQHANTEIALRFAKDAIRIAPTYYVTGNHEASCSQYDALKIGLETAGVIVLNDEIVYLEQNGEIIALLGLADPDFTIKSDLFGEVPAMIDTKLKNMLEQETAYSILLSHRPELFETYATCGVDLVLSGHAHGGQFRLPLIGGVIAPDQGLFPQYDAGLFTKGNTNMVVSRGLGNSIIPLRFNNHPEIVLIELGSNKE